ncbi:hypothetical protein ZWY2020_031773 [Hordeum vulgare]|nr:hypothetical protein ZWY2020_031773 [Hordeum vulgare]
MHCECCRIAEECTPTYIGRVRAHFHGKWVCGLCAEAVKERQQRDPDLAVDATAALCQGFNSTVRLNPKLSLASSMRNIARKSCQNCATGPGSCTAAGNSSDAMCCGAGRATSCALPYV